MGYLTKKEIEENLGLVYFCINKYFQNNNLEKDDLFQSGCLGLLNANEKFKPELGYEFSTYAIKSIYCTIATFIINYNKDMYSRYDKKIIGLIRKLKDLEKSDEEIKKELNLNDKQYNYYSLESRIAFSLDEEYKGNNSKTEKLFYKDIIPDNHDYIKQTKDRDFINSISKILTEDEYKLFYLYFIKEEKQEYIAKKYKISQAQISRKLKDIRKKLKDIYYGNK